MLAMAREFQRADWRCWLASMSCSEFKTWADYFGHRPFSVDLWDCEFAALQLTQARLAGVTDTLSVADFRLFPVSRSADVTDEMSADLIMVAAAGIAGGERFEQ